MTPQEETGLLILKMVINMTKHSVVRR